LSERENDLKGPFAGKAGSPTKVVPWGVKNKAHMERKSSDSSVRVWVNKMEQGNARRTKCATRYRKNSR